MSSRDYTRWNRAGLRRIDYVDRNAVSLLEDLRLALVERFPTTWTNIHDDELDRGTDTTLSEHNVKIEARYEAEPGDPGWELARSFARACHVLIGHIDAYANEHYVETASQWDSLRRLFAMLDYAPSPPASASTPLVLSAKAEGRIEVGALQVSYSPPDSDTVVFENLEALDVDPSFNAMRLIGWNRSAEFVDVRGMIWEPPESLELSVGALAIVERLATGEAFATTIDYITHGRLGLAAAPDEPWPVAETTLLLEPKAGRRPRLQGQRLVHVEPGHGFHAGDVVAWSTQEGWQVTVVKQTDVDRLQLGTNSLPAVDTELFAVKHILDADQARLPVDLRLIGWYISGRPTVRDYKQVTVVIDPNKPEDGEPRAPKFRRLGESHHRGAAFIITGVDEAKTTVTTATTAGWLCFEGSPATWETGAWFIAARNDDQLEAIRLLEIETLDKGFLARFERTSTRPIVQVHGPFKQRLRPRGWDFDTRVVSGSKLIVEAMPSPALLGRQVLVRAAGAPGAHLATVIRRTGTVLELAPPLPAALGLRAGELEIHANVLVFGHGERKPTTILGSGNATQSNQRFLLAVEGVSFVADPSRTTGVRAAIELVVGGRRWEQVDTLRDSGPTDEHYTVRMTEDGELRIQTGDGRSGRRVPSGSNNVRVALRVGVGLGGNVRAGSFKRLAKPHRLVSSLLQPLPATGGNDMAGTTKLREQAPGTVLALGRAVALEDFGLLAANHASVWQARARRLPVSGAFEQVEVIVVPAGGGALSATDAETLREFLLARTLPDVEIHLRSDREREFSLLVRVAIKTQAYEPEPVIRSLREALERRFSLQRRRLGQAVELAAIVEVVETTEGVDHSGVILDDDPEITSLVAGFDEVLVLGELTIISTQDTSRVMATTRIRRMIERRPVTFIQGIGTLQPAVYESELAKREPPVELLHELAALDPGWLQQLSPDESAGSADELSPPAHLLREFISKARHVLALAVSEPLIAKLGSRTLAELLLLDATLLATHHEVELELLIELRERLRVLQLCLDEPAMATIRLAEFSTTPELADQLPVQDDAELLPPPLASLPATIIAGIGERTAELLAQPPTQWRTVADVAYMYPERAAERASSLYPANMWEVHVKARMLLELRLSDSIGASIRAHTVVELLALDRTGLAKLTGASGDTLEQLHELLMTLELTLEQPPIPRLSGPTIERLTLADLFGDPHE